jgi:hypothetical protein
MTVDQHKADTMSARTQALFQELMDRAAKVSPGPVFALDMTVPDGSLTYVVSNKVGTVTKRVDDVFDLLLDQRTGDPAGFRLNWFVGMVAKLRVVPTYASLVAGPLVIETGHAYRTRAGSKAAVLTRILMAEDGDGVHWGLFPFLGRVEGFRGLVRWDHVGKADADDATLDLVSEWGDDGPGTETPAVPG